MRDEHTIAAQLRRHLEAKGHTVRYIHYVPTQPEFLIVALWGQKVERLRIDRPTWDTFRLEIVDVWKSPYEHTYLN